LISTKRKGRTGEVEFFAVFEFFADVAADGEDAAEARLTASSTDAVFPVPGTP
jgi:hypothetical protein